MERDNLRNGNFGGMKWTNITVQEIIHFYGVMIQIYIDPWNLGGYTPYFESISIIICGQGCTVILEAYGGWASKITSLSHFK